jgi:hypothetical protein
MGAVGTKHLVVLLPLALALGTGCRHVEAPGGGDGGGGDDDSVIDYDSDGEIDPCDVLLDLFYEVMEEVCGDFPGCSVCDIDDLEFEYAATDSDCQMVLDAFGYDELFELYSDICELEAGP